MANTTITRWLDLGERTAATYVQAFAGLLLADSTHLLSLGAVRAAAVAALPAALAILKAALALGLGTSGTAAMLPAAAPGPVPVAPSMAESDVPPAADGAAPTA